MSHRLPFQPIVLETNPRIYPCRRHTTHKKRPDRLFLARIKERQDGEPRGEVPRPDEREQRKRGGVGWRDRDADRVAEGLGVYDAVGAATDSEDAHGGHERWEDAVEVG